MPQNIQEIQDEIISDCAEFGQWLDLYEYLIKKGKHLEGAADDLLTDEYLISGCQSQVWLKAEYFKDAMRFVAFSDSAIIRGMICLLLEVFNDQKPEDIATAELYFLDTIGLSSHLSPSRANGLRSIIHHMRACAEEAVNNR